METSQEMSRGWRSLKEMSEETCERRRRLEKKRTKRHKGRGQEVKEEACKEKEE